MQTCLNNILRSSSCCLCRWELCRLLPTGRVQFCRISAGDDTSSTHSSISARGVSPILLLCTQWHDDSGCVVYIFLLCSLATWDCLSYGSLQWLFTQQIWPQCASIECAFQAPCIVCCMVVKELVLCLQCGLLKPVSLSATFLRTLVILAILAAKTLVALTSRKRLACWSPCPYIQIWFFAVSPLHLMLPCGIMKCFLCVSQP